MRNVMLVSVMVTSLLTACQNDGEFVGKWVGVKSDCTTMEIVQNGDHLLAKIKTPDMFMGGYAKMSVPATAKDGMLSINMSHTVTMTIEKSSGELVGENVRYRRPTGNEKCTMKE